VREKLGLSPRGPGPRPGGTNKLEGSIMIDQGPDRVARIRTKSNQIDTGGG